MDIAMQMDEQNLGRFRSLVDQLNQAMNELVYVTTELARVTGERDRLIEAWPVNVAGCGPRVHKGNAGFWVMPSQKGPFDTKAAAVRAAAGLGAEGETP